MRTTTVAISGENEETCSISVKLAGGRNSNNRSFNRKKLAFEARNFAPIR
jgi:hypothetical protein